MARRTVIDARRIPAIGKKSRRGRRLQRIGGKKGQNQAQGSHIGLSPTSILRLGDLENNRSEYPRFLPAALNSGVPSRV
jgi:hypothetical protein